MARTVPSLEDETELFVDLANRPTVKRKRTVVAKSTRKKTGTICVLCLACGRPSLHDRSGPRLGSRRRLALAAERSHDWSRKWRHSVHWHHRRESRARLPPSLLLGSIESFQRRAAIWRLIPPAAGDLENCEEEAPQLARGRMKSSPLPSRRSLSPLRPSAFLLPLRRRFPSLSTSSHQKHLPETPPTGPPFPSPLSLSLRPFPRLLSPSPSSPTTHQENVRRWTLDGRCRHQDGLGLGPRARGGRQGRRLDQGRRLQGRGARRQVRVEHLHGLPRLPDQG